MRPAVAFCAAILAAALIGIAPDVCAQTGSSDRGQPDEIPSLIERVPKLNLSFGVGSTTISGFQGRVHSPTVIVGAQIPFLRYFNVELEAGHVKASQRYETPGYSFNYAGDPNRPVTTGPITYQETLNIWYGAAMLEGRLEIGRATLWAGAGLTFGGDTGSFSITAHGCSAPAIPHFCDAFYDVSSGHVPFIGPRFGGGADVTIARGIRAYGSVNLTSTPSRLSAFQAGIRVPVSWTTQVRRASLGSEPLRRLAARAGDSDLRLKQGEKVWVTTNDGVVRTGHVIRLSQSAISLLVGGGTTSLDFAQIARIEKSDSLVNGLRNGAVAGGSAMAMLSTFGGYFGGGDESANVAVALTLSAIGAGVGTLVGGLIDARHESRQPVYQAPTGVAISVAPVVVRRGAGFQLRWIW